MALSGVERARRCREKEIAAGLSEAIKEKDCQRIQLTRSKMTTSRLNVLRLRQRVNLQRYRARKKVNSVPPSPLRSSFSKKQAKINALSKIKSVLPTNKVKQKELIRKVAEVLNILKLDKRNKIVQQSVKKNLKDKICQFYCRDDISYQTPGKRDTITSEENGNKNKLQKRYLLYSLRETYQLFLKGNQDITLGRSTFQDLRPLNVFYKSLIPHNVCICLYHENITFLLKALNGCIH